MRTGDDAAYLVAERRNNVGIYEVKNMSEGKYIKTEQISDALAEIGRCFGRETGKRNRMPEIKKVLFRNPATIVEWADGTKTVVNCQDNVIHKEKDGKDTTHPRPSYNYDPYIGLAMCICKKAYGNTGYFNNVFKKHVKDYEV